MGSAIFSLVFFSSLYQIQATISRTEPGYLVIYIYEDYEGYEHNLRPDTTMPRSRYDPTRRPEGVIHICTTSSLYYSLLFT